MKIGAYLKVKNEARNVCRVVDYHLNCQGFDLMIVIDNGSTDDTIGRLKAMRDPRIIIVSTTVETGFQHHYLCTMAARDLFMNYDCDWVIPIDADEYWHSRRWGSVRKALKHAARITVKTGMPYLVLHTTEFRFFESEMDNALEKDFIRRLQYCCVSSQQKVIMYRLGKRIKAVDYGSHSVTLSDDCKDGNRLELKRPDLARFHYPHYSKQDHIKRTLNKVEGYLIASRGAWLKGDITENNLGLHVFEHYRKLKAGEFDNYYRNNFYLTRTKINSGMQDGTIKHVDDMLKFFPDG